MKHRTTITPLNCSWTAGLNAIMQMEVSAYEALSAASRGTYCKSPDLSWFKMKSAPFLSPYIEPAFFGLKVGDIITAEFDALLFSGAGLVQLSTVPIISGNTLGTVVYYDLSSVILKSHYEHFKISMPIMSLATNQIGVMINIRPNSAVATASEIIFKNVEIEIETTNENFSLYNNIVKYSNKQDYLKCINIYSGTDVRTTYNTLLDLYTAAEVSFPDDSTIAFTGSTNHKFRGLCTEFTANNYPNPYAIYFEYVSSDANVLYLTTTLYNIAGTPTQHNETPVVAVGALTKKIIYVSGTNINSFKTFIDIGRVSVAANYQIKNMKFSNPRFDDYDKKPPNQLEDLYTNLGAKLRA